MTCKECIHEKVCDALIKSGCPYLDEEIPADAFCIEFRNTADVAEVVRCKDCKHYRNHPNGLFDCWAEPSCNERGYKGDMHCVEPDDFCSFGERKE